MCSTEPVLCGCRLGLGLEEASEMMTNWEFKISVDVDVVHVITLCLKKMLMHEQHAIDNLIG